MRGQYFNTQYTKQSHSEDLKIWTNQKTGSFPKWRHILKCWKVTESDGTLDITVQYSKALDEFQLRWLESEGIYAAFHISKALFPNHPKKLILLYGVSITFGIMFFFDFGFDVPFLFMKSFVKKENFGFLLIRRCHISRIWNFSMQFQYYASGRLSPQNPARFGWLILNIKVFENVFFEKSIPEVIINCFDKFVSIFQSFWIELRKVTLMGLFISF